MVSVFDRLRSGEAVDIGKGRKGRLNPETKTLETSEGRRIYVGDDPDFYPVNENALKLSREKESLERDIARAPQGAGDFLYQFGQQGIAGAAKDWVNKIIMKGDDYTRRKQAEQEISQRVSERSPYASAGSTLASFGPDIALTSGMSAAKAVPALTTMHAGPRILEEPVQVAQEAAIGSAGGYLIDKGAAFLNRVAQRRAQSRAMPQLQAEAEQRNLAGQQATNEMNAATKQRYGTMNQLIKSENAQIIRDHEMELLNRKNQMIDAQNVYENAKTARDSQIIKLKSDYEIAKANRSADMGKLESEYKAAKVAAEEEEKRLNAQYQLAQRQYKEAIKKAPELQRQAQKEYSENVIKQADRIRSSFPKDAKISTSEINATAFIEDLIQQTGKLNTPEGMQASRLLKSLYPEGETLTAAEFAARYKSIEDAIQRASPETKMLLNEFKAHLGDRIPSILADNIAFNRVVPSLEKQFEKELEGILKKFGRRSGFATPEQLIALAKQNSKTYFNNLTPTNFMEKMRNGDLRKQFMDQVLSAWDLFPPAQISPGKKAMQLGKGEMANFPIPALYQEQFGRLQNEIDAKIANALAKSEIKIMGIETDVARKLGASVSKTQGLADTLPAPIPPSFPQSVPIPPMPEPLPPVRAPQIPEPIAPPQQPPLPARPQMIEEMVAPSPASFSPESLPNLPPAQGMGEQMGDLLEKNLMGGKGMVNNPIAKLAGLKYLLGKAALPLEAGYVGMQAMTSPGAAGRALRTTFERGGIEGLDIMARRYPSYRNGILESPQDRRAFSKEIEDDSSIPLGEKALLQSKVNRGKSLFDRIQ
jgi:hypothetical protein